eukprot:60259_1
MSRVNNTLKNKKKEPYMNVQNIIIEPGRDFIQWKLMAQTLLKQRENELMNVRCDMTQSIINKAITQFTMEHRIKINETFYFDETFKQNTLQELYKKIDAWNGVQVTRLKKNDMNSFKAYFVIGKNWLDQNKKKVWAPYFWIKLFIDIQTFAANMGNNELNQKCLLLQKEYSHCLELKIMKSLFIDGTVQFIQTKQQPLIPHGTIKYSREIQEYLLHLDKSLAINNWCEKQKQSQKMKDALNKKKRKRTGNAKLLVEQLQQTLITLVSDSENKLLNINIYCNDITNCKHISLQASCTYVQQLPPKIKIKQQPKQQPKQPPKPPPPPGEFIFEQIPQIHNIQQPICNTIKTQQ